jgi:ribosomal protein S18 acetylase RimI-like enzyme
MIDVRTLTPQDDLTAVLQLCRDFFREYERHHPGFFEIDGLSDEAISGRFKESLESERSVTVIALVDDEIVGYALASIREQPPFYRVKHVGAISGLMVAPKFRRRGLGSRLLLEIEAYFRRHDIRYFTLYTSIANQGAIKLYERLGLEFLQAIFLGDTKR